MTRSNSAAAILQGEARVLEVIDKHTQVNTGEHSGWLAGLLASRRCRLVLQLPCLHAGSQALQNCPGGKPTHVRLPLHT